MKLKRIEKELPPVRLKLSVAGSLNEALEGYAAYYREVHGEALSVQRLMVEMARSFMESDREFQAWLKRAPGRPASGPQARLRSGVQANGAQSSQAQ